MKYCMPRQIFPILCVLLGYALQSAGQAPAHVSADNMPDSVAETEYLIYLEFKPEDMMIRNKLGMVYYRLGKFKSAAGEFSRILQRDPGNYDALDGMGLVRAAQQNYAEALNYHRQALALNPDDMMIHYHLGCALEKNGLRSEAAAAYQAALSRYHEQYPDGAGGKQAAEFLETVRTALNTLEKRQ